MYMVCICGFQWYPPKFVLTLFMGAATKFTLGDWRENFHVLEYFLEHINILREEIGSYLS